MILRYILFSFLISISLFAQETEINFDYEITNFSGDKQEVRDLFSSLWSRFKSYDNYHCYRRAHVLANQMKHKEILSAKVFIFLGSQMRREVNWWYHVAPLVKFKNEEVVMDRGLFDGPTYLSDWLESFSGPDGCKQIHSYSEYSEQTGVKECMYIIAPMYHYGPSTLKENMNSFDQAQLSDSIFSIPRRHRKKYIYNYPIKESL